MKQTLALVLMVFGISGCLSTPPEQLKASGEDFPILLTCELGALISYITLKDDGTGSAIFNGINLGPVTSGINDASNGVAPFAW